MKKKYQSTLSYALLIYISIIVVLIALIPFDFRPPREFKIICSTNFADFITNIFFFIPVGFLFRLSRRQSKDILCLNALIFGLLLSSAIEFTQVFITAAALYGGVIYRLQLSSIRNLWFF